PQRHLDRIGDQVAVVVHAGHLFGNVVRHRVDEDRAALAVAPGDAPAGDRVGARLEVVVQREAIGVALLHAGRPGDPHVRRRVEDQQLRGGGRGYQVAVPKYRAGVDGVSARRLDAELFQLVPRQVEAGAGRVVVLAVAVKIPLNGRGHADDPIQ